MLSGLCDAHKLSPQEAAEYFLGIDGVHQHYTRDSLHSLIIEGAKENAADESISDA